MSTPPSSARGLWRTRVGRLWQRARRAWHTEVARRLRRVARRVVRGGARVGWYGGAVVVVLLAVFFTVARVLLPDVAERKGELEARLTQASGHPIRIDALGTYWDGLSPGLHLRQVMVLTPDGRAPVIRLREVHASLALLPLLWGEVRVKTLRLTSPALALERLADRRYRIRGFEAVGAEATAGGGEVFLDWLFRQHHIVVEDGELHWLDHLERERPLTLRHVNASLRNDGRHHRLRIDAAFPPALCERCAAVFDVRGNPLTDAQWKGDIYLELEGVDTTQLPRVLSERLPPALRARLSTALWSAWEDGRPTEVSGRVRAAGLRLPLAERLLHMQEASGELDWRRRAEGWALTLKDAALGLGGAARALGTLRIDYQPSESRIEAGRVYLEDLTSVVQTLARTRAAPAAEARTPAEIWAQLAPQGLIENLKIRVDGELAQPSEFAAQGEVQALTTRAVGAIPGVRNLHGKFAIGSTEGELELKPAALAVEMPRLFRAPLTTTRATGRLSWQRTEESWVVVGEKLRAANADVRASGRLRLRLPHDRAAAPHLTLRVDYEDGNAAQAERYYPIRYLPEKVRTFLEQSIIAGEVTHGHLIYEGVASDFPFREGHGRFEVVGHARNAVYRYLPGWPPVQSANVDVVVRGGDVRISGNGKVGQLDLKQVEVLMELPGGARQDVRVRGVASGTVAQALSVLRHVKPVHGAEPAWKDYLPDGLRAQGEGVLELAVEVPFGDDPARIRGEYRVTNADLSIDAPALSVEALDGQVQFTEAGARSGTLRGRFLGGESLAVLVTGDDGARELQASGRLVAQRLAPLVGSRIGAQLAGDAMWHVSWRERAGRAELLAEMPLDRIQATLPAPLDRPQALARHPLRIQTEASSATGLVLAVSVGPEAGGRLALARDRQGWRLERGRIGFGEPFASLPSVPETQLAVKAEAVDLDGWLELLGGRGAGQGAPAVISRFFLNTGNLMLFDRDLGPTTFDLQRGASGWGGSVAGAAAAGRLRFVGEPVQALELEFARLRVPAARPQAPPARKTETDPRRLLGIQARIEALTVKDLELGQLELQGHPTPDGWRVERFRLAREEMNATGTGRWMAGPSSEVNLQFETRDAGKTMAAFHAPDQLAGGQAHIDATLNWPGTPADVQAANVSGRLEVKAKDGQFLRAKTGAARLFGILDLSSLARYLQFDFSPIFGKGFLYDELGGTITLERGNAYTQDLSIKGPAATLTFNGRVGLAAEDYELFLGVAPKFSTGVTLTTFALFGPAVAVAAAAIQQLFKQQIAEGVRLIYVVKGSWQEPQVTRLTTPGAEGASP